MLATTTIYNGVQVVWLQKNQRLIGKTMTHPSLLKEIMPAPCVWAGDKHKWVKPVTALHISML